MMRERIFRALLLLHPRSFRREYGAHMLQVYRDARRDDVASCTRLTSDIVATLPRHYKEAFVHLNPQGKLIAAALVVMVAIVAFAAIGGALIALALMLMLAWILTRLLQRRSAAPPEGLWWKLTAGGGGLMALVFVVFAPPWPESWRSAVPGELAWWTGFAAVVASIVLMATGMLMGVAQRVSRRHAMR
jgi:hypothetical protein